MKSFRERLALLGSRFAVNAAAALFVACNHVAQAPAPPPPPASLLDGVTFTQYSALSTSTEIARRVLTPLTSRAVQKTIAKGALLREQSIDLAREKFVVYVPAAAPPGDGYGLLVFVPPWDVPSKPRIWRPPLDRHGLIFVAATNSGNETSLLDRRVPLALLGTENVRARYPIDPSRVYVFGLSGGSRVAEILALAYPDVFRGALLNAGSDPIGGELGIYIPPKDLFRKFQDTRLVYITGAHDELNLHDDEISRDSMRSFCVFDVEVLKPPDLSHEQLDAGSLNRALDALERHAAVDERRRAQCNADIERDLSAKLADAEAALARGDRDGALSRIKAIDAHYGGLAAPEIVELEARRAILR